MEIDRNGDAHVSFPQGLEEKDTGVFRGGRHLYETVRNELAPLRTVALDVDAFMASAALDKRFAGFECGANISHASPWYVTWSNNAPEQRMVMAQQLCPSKEVQAVAARIERASEFVWCAAEQRRLLDKVEKSHCAVE